jgi:predicted lipoprotein with Yx(FWY)xxD motif
MQKRASAGFSAPQFGQITTRPSLGRDREPVSVAVRTAGEEPEGAREVRTRSIVFAAVAAMSLAACSSGSGGGAYGGGGSTSSSSASGGAAATVAIAEVGDLGTVLVDGTGRTLYLFESDTGTTSTCTGSCAGMWPALVTDGTATAGAGAASAMLGTTTRDDGTTQVTYDGHPLYLYSGDSAAGDANGQGIGDVWYAVTSSGAPAYASSNSGGNGYGPG